ncbi:D-Ala-D-Ala carboxypeptidase [Xanthomonas bromi]|uniref:D-Ala-D-Ala carboxypeptidase n=1 Tax=Xanthomonas bromi TaxID=56449 RepID=A0A1C3NKI7_9XANT|nr:serine hydrolase domain-containing protein [Xanthomonas bromi]SBV50906.1 D-Ala-D-Ala carboxypeptidase [Xanthomonas bromi]
MMVLVTALRISGPAGTKQPAPQASATAALVREADAFFKGSRPGGVVLVTRGNQVLLRQTYGMADIEKGIAMQANAVLRLASVSKQLTAIAMCNWCRQASCVWTPQIKH